MLKFVISLNNFSNNLKRCLTQNHRKYKYYRWVQAQFSQAKTHHRDPHEIPAFPLQVVFALSSGEVGTDQRKDSGADSR